ncbi:MAG: glycosyltransferase [Sandaracinaceae bacterium]|nr:glycosyltransferase [Sandaracinaceae bacterium]
MLTGILYANAITTVSPTYAREITTPEHGVGLDAFLRARREVLFGILNGIDESEWSPSRDPLIPFHYSADDPSGKGGEQGAAPAQRRPALPARRPPLRHRLAPRLAEGLRPVLRRPARAPLAARGAARRARQRKPRYEDLFARLARLVPHKVAFRNAFSEPLAHLIEAGSDLFLMPSRYEPCGLNQMYSLAYGTPPVVHKTGGLADTVQLWSAETGRGNGFVFDHFDARGFTWAIRYALEQWGDRAAWRKLRDNGMREDFSWSRRVREYEELYAKLA